MAGIFAPAAGAPALAGAGGRDIHPAPPREERSDDALSGRMTTAPHAPAGGALRTASGGRSFRPSPWWESPPPLAPAGGAAPCPCPRATASTGSLGASSTRHTPAHPPVKGDKHSHSALSSPHTRPSAHAGRETFA